MTASGAVPPSPLCSTRGAKGFLRSSGRPRRRTRRKKRRCSRTLDADPPRQRRTRWLAGSASVCRWCAQAAWQKYTSNVFRRRCGVGKKMTTWSCCGNKKIHWKVLLEQVIVESLSDSRARPTKRKGQQIMMTQWRPQLQGQEYFGHLQDLPGKCRNGDHDTTPGKLRDRDGRSKLSSPWKKRRTLCFASVQLTTAHEEGKDVGRSSPTVCPPRTCGWRDNPQQPMAPRCQGSRGPSLRSALMQPTLVREYLCQLRGSYQGRFLFGMPARGPSRPLLVGFRVAALDSVRHCTGQVATDPQSPEGGSQRACHTEGAHPTASGRFATVALFKQSALLGSLEAVSLGCQPGKNEWTPFLWSVLGSSPNGNSLPAWDCLFRYSHTAWVSSSTRGGGDRTTSLPRDSVRRDAHRPARPSDSGTFTPWSSPQAHAALVIRLRRRCRRHSTQEPPVWKGQSGGARRIHRNCVCWASSWKATRSCLQCRRHEAPSCVLGVGLQYSIGVGHQVNHGEIHLLHTWCGKWSFQSWRPWAPSSHPQPARRGNPDPQWYLEEGSGHEPEQQTRRQLLDTEPWQYSRIIIQPSQQRTHCLWPTAAEKRENDVHVNLNWCTELEDTVWRIQIPCCIKGIGIEKCHWKGWVVMNTSNMKPLMSQSRFVFQLLS